LLDNFGEAAVDQRLRPLLAYAGKLTTSPAKMVQADADAVFAKGWDERALYDATAVSALFNYLNRMVEGAGIKLEAGYPEAAAPLLSTKGYGTRFRDQDEIG
jgi:alkylhydroperoxidase family enzyme